MMNFGTEGSRRRGRHMLLALCVVVGVAACAEPASKNSSSSETVAQTKTKNAALATCTVDTKCSVGATGAAGGTVIYNGPMFRCGQTSTGPLPCNFLELARWDWAGPMIKNESPVATGCELSPDGVDMRCPWGRSDVVLPGSNGSQLGDSRFVQELITVAVPDPVEAARAVAVAAAYDYPPTGIKLEANPFTLPSLEELVLACNAANGSPSRTDACVPGTLKPQFQPDWYWSSTYVTKFDQPAYAVNFLTGEIALRSRQQSNFIRPIRSFYSILDASAATTLPPPTTVKMTTLPPTTVKVTTVPPTTVNPTTVPPTVTTATTTPAPPKTCDPTSPCKLGDVMTDGGTVFYYSATGFPCDGVVNTDSRVCNMLAVAPPGWFPKAKSAFGSQGPCMGTLTVVEDPKCFWNTNANADYFGVATSGDLGQAMANNTRVTSFLGTIGRTGLTAFVRAFAGQGGLNGSYALPTSSELNLLCNWVNGSAPSTTSCKATGRLKPGFAAGSYWGSNLSGPNGGPTAAAANFATGEVGFYCRCLTYSVRPVRAFRGFPDPSMTPVTTVPPITLPPTTVPPTTIPPTTSPTCANGGTCKLGDTGPGGGKVFFVGSTSFACGPNLDKQCKYLEFAPLNWRTSPVADCVLGEKNDFLACPWPMVAGGTRPATSTALGTGAKNTAAMYALAPTPGLAAVRAYNGGGKTDWFLASEREANELCKWAHASFKGPTPGDPSVECKGMSYSLMFSGLMPMWTSSDVSATTAWTMQVLNANPQMAVGEKTGIGLFWPIRAF